MRAQSPVRSLSAKSMVDVAPDAQYAEPVPEELEYEGDAIPQPKDMPPFDMGEEDF